VAVLSREEFDAIEFDAVRSGDHAAAAELMNQLAATAAETVGMPRAEAFLRAGEQYLLADDPAAAVGGFRRAMVVGGPVFVDPRVPLARALFQLGRYAEAQALISRLKAEGPQDPRVCDLVAELLVDRSDLRGALDWATAGVELCLSQADTANGDGQAPAVPALAQGGDDESELRLLLSLRYRIRNDLGLPEDRYDALL
jgi:tetratricopeptide (TPR) repeat protein